MSGRPSDPSYTVLEWSPDTNYPAGPESWSSNPTKVDPPGRVSVGFTPAQGNAAQYHNFGHNAWSVAHANAKSAIATVLEYVGQVPAMHFPTATAGPGGASNNGAFFAKATGKWFICCNSEDVRSSVDQGASWAQESGVATAGAGENCLSGDADDSGNVLIATSTRYVFALDVSTGTWTKVDAYGGAFTNKARVVYAAGQWLWTGVIGTAAAVQVSADRATWFAGGAIAGASWTANVFDLAVNKTSGRAIFAGYYGAGAVRVCYTDNGGNSWTTLASDLAIGLGSSPTEIALSHNADESAWYLTVGETSGTHASEVWRSTDDGASWTKVATLANYCMRRVAGFGALLVGVASSSSRNDVVYSLDGGATWEKSAIWPSGSLAGVYSGAGRPMVLTSSTAYVGIAMGKPSLGSIT